MRRDLPLFLVALLTVPTMSRVQPQAGTGGPRRPARLRRSPS